MAAEGTFSMKISLTPVTLTPAEFEIVAIAARENGVTVAEFIARTSMAAARRTLHSQQRDWGTRERKSSLPFTDRQVPPER
jgi:hypothetical protein